MIDGVALYDPDPAVLDRAVQNSPKAEHPHGELSALLARPGILVVLVPLPRERVPGSWPKRRAVRARSASLPARSQTSVETASASRRAAATARERLDPISTLSEDVAEHDAALQAARATLGGAAFDAAWAEGQAMSPDEAVEYALEEIGCPKG